MTKGTITFDLRRYARLKAYHRAAKAQGKDDFTFDGQGLLTSYAGYLIEFLASEWNSPEVEDLTCLPCDAKGCIQCEGRGHFATAE